MKNQILLLFLIVTSCYCKDETTYSELSTESELLTNNSDSDSTNQTKSMVTTTTAKNIVTTKTQTTTKITPIADNPLLGKITPEILKLVIDLLPNLLSTPDKVISFETKKSELFDELDKLNLDWKNNCSLARIYYKLLEEEFEKNRDDKVVKEERLKKLIPCKRDCNFDRLLNANYSEDRKNFSKTFLPFVSSDVARFCQNTLGTYLAPVRNDSQPLKLSDITAITDGSIPLGTIFTLSQISTIPSSDVLDVLKKFENSIDDDSARKLGKKIPRNTSFADVAHVAAFIPAEILSEASPSDLIRNFDGFSSKIDSSKALLVTSKISSNGTKAEFKEFLAKVDSKFAEKIPLNIFLKFNLSVSDLPDKSIPSSYRENLLTGSLTPGKTVADLDESVLKTVVTKISRAELNQVPKEKKKDAVISLLKSSTDSSQIFTSSQRSAFLDSLLQSWADATEAQKAANFDALSTEDVEAIAEVIVAANESVYSWLRNTQKFSTIIEKNSKMDSSKCCSFLYRSRTLYASEAIRKLVTAANITSNHLNSLGPCFASLIPQDYLYNLETSEIESQIDYFNIQSFQPNASIFSTLKTKLNSLYDTKATDTDKTSLLSQMGSLAVFMDESKVDQSLVKNSVSSMLSNIKSERNVDNEDVAKCRVGSGNDDQVKTFVANWNKRLVGAWFSLTSSRRKRSTTALTCDIVNQVISAIDLVPESYFASMTTTEYEKCVETLGNIDYSLTTKQYEELAKKKDITTIADSEIPLYSKILTGYSNTDLAKLNVESLTSVQTLGQIDSFSSSQLSNIVTAIKGKMGAIDNEKLNYLGNLACGLSSSDLSQITNEYFKENVKAVSLINMADCSSIGSLYTKAKQAMSISSLTSVEIADIGSVVAGISTDEAKNLDTRAIQALSTNTLRIMPATAVNSFSAVQIQSLSSDQLSSLLNSPNADQFSEVTKTLLDSAAQNVDVTRSDVLSELTTTSGSISVNYNIMILIIPIFFRFI